MVSLRPPRNADCDRRFGNSEVHRTGSTTLFASSHKGFDKTNGRPRPLCCRRRISVAPDRWRAPFPQLDFLMSLDGAGFVVRAEKLAEDHFQLSVEVAGLCYKAV